jgi:processive 1,2-diacylglycerol beta-glucosyltransferase
MKRRGKIRVPLYATITDFYPHAFWVYDFVDKYYVANEESLRNLTRRGPREEEILVSGIPIDPVFAELPPKEAAKAKLSLDQKVPAILVLNGGFGVGKMEVIVESFRASDGDFQLLVVAGKNEKLKKKLSRMTRSFRCHTQVYGFVEGIHELMNVSDLIISKPGGLSSSEALASGLPMILVDPIPGQEDRNCEYLLEKGVAVRLCDLDDAYKKVESLLEHPEKIQEMKRRAVEVARPEASLAITEDILSDLQSKSPALSRS